jgi:hypothetical protein
MDVLLLLREGSGPSNTRLVTFDMQDECWKLAPL